MFFETINAAGVMQVPMVISVWDDGYGISVSNKDQTIKESISEALKGFQRSEDQLGIEIISVKGWDYLALIEAYQFASKLARKSHVPVLVHVTELTQPLGHSSSGAHERYKSKKRLEWEKEYDCNTKMRAWILKEGFASEEDLEIIEKNISKEVKTSKTNAWEAYQNPILKVVHIYYYPFPFFYYYYYYYYYYPFPFFYYYYDDVMSLILRRLILNNADDDVMSLILRRLILNDDDVMSLILRILNDDDDHDDDDDDDDDDDVKNDVCVLMLNDEDVYR